MLPPGPRSLPRPASLAALLTASSLGLASAPAKAQGPGRPPVALSVAEAPADTHLSVATDGLSDPDMREPVRRAVLRDARPVFELVADMGRSLEGVEIDVTMSEPEAPGVVEVSLTGRGPGELRKQERIRCEYCTESELVAKTIDAVGKLLPRLAAAAPAGSAPAETSPSSEPPPTDASRPAADDTPRRSDDRRAPLGPLGIGGAVGMGLGAALVIPGVIFAVQPDRVDSNQPGDVTVRSTRVPGYALVGAGAGVFAVGVGLLVADRVRARRAGADPSQASAQLVPTGRGLAVVGRF